MKKSNIHFFVLFGLSTLFFGACNDKDQDLHYGDITPPSLLVTSPANYAEFANGNNIIIEGITDDKNGLHDLHIYLVKQGTTDTLVDYFKSMDDKNSYTLAETVAVNGITAETPAVMTILLEDHEYNGAVKSIYILLKP